MKRSMFRLLTISLSIFAVALFAGSVLAQGRGGGNGGGNGNGNGNGGGEDPPPASVQFEISAIDMPVAAPSYVTVRAMNNHGQIVGDFENNIERRAFLYDANINSTSAIDLNILGLAPEGWYIRTAYDINDDGLIVGSLGREGDPSIAGGANQSRSICIIQTVLNCWNCQQWDRSLPMPGVSITTAILLGHLRPTVDMGFTY